MIKINLEHSIKGTPLSEADNFGRLLMDLIGACSGEERIEMKKFFPDEVRAWEKHYRSIVIERLKIMIPKADIAYRDALRKVYPKAVKAFEKWFFSKHHGLGNWWDNLEV